MVVRISDKTQNYSKVTKLLVKPRKNRMKTSKTISEYKEFIAKGNVMDMAVGVIIGGAFGKIVTSLVNDILMPIIGVLIGGLDFTV